MPHPPLARVQLLLEDGLRLARQMPLPRLRLTEALPQLLIARRCGILEVVPKRLSALERVRQHAGHVSDVHFGLAALHDLVDVTAGAKPSNDALSLSCGRRPQHDVESGKVHI